MRIAYLGPEGTFSEEALLSEPDLAEGELVACSTIIEAIRRVADGDVDGAFVPIENSIEGPVTMTLDELVFGVDLFITREVIHEVHEDLAVVPGATFDVIREVVSMPVAAAQCRAFVEDRLPGARLSGANSTAEAARLVAERASLEVAAITTPLSAKLYGLEVLAHGIEDFSDNKTRFVLVTKGSLSPRSGHDRTTIVCFQHADRPGSLHQILGQFAARNLNLTRIESRPTKQALGDYCFVIEFEGHIDEEIVGDVLKELYMELESIKFLGSYPISGERASELRERLELERQVADAWLGQIRGLVGDDRAQ